MNTGSPDAPTEEAVRDYLRAFLMDPHVIDLPWPLRALLVHGIILPRRPAESAKAYKAIWADNGSPLIHYCTELANRLRKRTDPLCELGMAYGNPSVKTAINRLLDSGVEELCLLPLFPQSAMATTDACVAKVKAEIKGRAALRVVPPFYKHPAFIRPLAESLADVDEHILFSYHGLPLRHLKKGNPYPAFEGKLQPKRGTAFRLPAVKQYHTATLRKSGVATLNPSEAKESVPRKGDMKQKEVYPNYRVQCMETTKTIVAKAHIPEERYSVSFQSRMGRTKWLEPYTNEVLRELPQRGIKRLAVICPGFFCDCLETLEEIGLRGKETFMEAGGESFRMIPCLNDSPSAVQCLESLMKDATL